MNRTFGGRPTCLEWPGALVLCIGLLTFADPSGAGEYRLGPEDVIDVQVLGRPDLSATVRVDPKGRVQLPLIGELESEGYTTAAFGQLLLDEYRLIDPDVSDVLVAVAEYNSQRVLVIGEVRGPGYLGFPEIPDLWAVLLEAGGPMPSADLSRVQVVRSGTREGSEGARMVTVDLSDGIEATLTDDHPTLFPKDTIIVPSLAEQGGGSGQIHVLGAVASPGSYRTAVAGSIVEALSAAGGPLGGAKLGEVRLTRTQAGGPVAFKLDLRDYLYDARPPADLALQDGDVVTIPAGQERPIENAIGLLSQLLPVAGALTGLILAFN